MIMSVTMMMTMLVLMLFLPPPLFPSTLQPRQRPHNLLSLLLHQILLHRIIVIVLPQQLLQLDFFLKQRPSLFLALLFAFPTGRPALQTPLPLLFLLAVSPLVSRMVHLQNPPHHARATEIVHREVGRALVFIFQEGEPFAFAGFFVADEVDVGRLAELGEYGQDVAFGEVKG